MTTNDTTRTAEITAETIEAELLAHLEGRTKTKLTPDHDLFGSGLVTSMFAMELVVHLEGEYDIVISGPDLKLENFRTVQSMGSLVLRLREAVVDRG
ncbi:acyl carrier protein [Streptomyces sp. NPDC090052]|uniref:acyl carrier protein n=1 Tax=unclassified Streptomyces TaxID=2593676 RepID=UPI0022555355|nr:MULTISPECIES: acyl carrier protein [unclassified Streptomyces]MCX4723197.1 acyl carrier protein [Streptomyces sp. NBC_01306]WSV07181.1 acyl carrier protein [Streptomyces sp. NBC_01020]WSX45295.1 acyl carrier protein [Streptomyces sp. NBC_00963]WSX66681.1 acyl carrier protein [Streptomyces sp. NBC_00932]